MFRRIVFLIASVAISWGIVYGTVVSKRLARQGEPLGQKSVISTVVSDRLDPLAGGILPLPPKLHVAPTQSIFGPSAASANPAPPSVNLHPRDLAATPLPSAPLIAGNASDSVHLTKDKKDESE